MILVDTSIWVDHLNKGDADLIELLGKGLVLMHQFVIGEIALGNLRQRSSILNHLHDLPLASAASEEEVLTFVEAARLHGTGIGYIDAHLLVAAKLNGAALWTRDTRLLKQAERLKLVYQV